MYRFKVIENTEISSNDFALEQQYAIVDIGSNSFHMLIVGHDGEDNTMIAKLKQKVRLAGGLNKKNELSLEAMERGWRCLELFAVRLKQIPKENRRVVATATMRIATNAQLFIEKAEQILDFPITIISGDEEAQYVYQGAISASDEEGKHLVIDIGGASTEIVIGDEQKPFVLKSLPVGCVTWLDRYFDDEKLTSSNFKEATKAAKTEFDVIAEAYKIIGWQICIGSSGTIQSVLDVIAHQGEKELTLSHLKEFRERCIHCETVNKLAIPGLDLERYTVFPSGVSILIALFESFDIKSLHLSGGALREGLLYSMINLD